jgi:hypothetical protein
MEEGPGPLEGGCWWLEGGENVCGERRLRGDELKILPALVRLRKLRGEGNRIGEKWRTKLPPPADPFGHTSKPHRERRTERSGEYKRFVVPPRPNGLHRRTNTIRSWREKDGRFGRILKTPHVMNPRLHRKME